MDTKTGIDAEGDNVVAIARLLGLDLEARLNERIDVYRSDSSGFQNRLHAEWAKPLKRFKGMSLICEEILQEIYADIHAKRIAFNPKVDASTRIFSRIIQMSNEVHHLSLGGFSEGGLSRWRSMHEASVVLFLLCDAEESISKRYIDYLHVQKFKSAEVYNSSLGSIDGEELDVELMSALRKNREAVLAEYGDSFRRSNGWAYPLMPPEHKGTIYFDDLEELSGHGALRFQYSMASAYVHAGYDSLAYQLGLSLSNNHILLTGPSNEGLTQPLIYSAMTLALSLRALSIAVPSPDRKVLVEVVWQWYESLHVEALDAMHALKIKGELLRAQSRKDA